METSRKNKILLTVLVASGLVVAFAIGTLAQAAVFASPPSSTGPQASPTDQAVSKAAQSQLLDMFMTNFTSRLGTDETKLQTAFMGAVSDTTDQAARQGLITQDQATEAKNFAQKLGIKGLIEQGFGMSGDTGPSNPADQYANPKMALMQALQSFGITPDQVKSDIEAGKSILDIAREHNVDPQTLKNTILADYRQQLNSAVHDGHLTQSQADDEYNGFAGSLDKMLSAFSTRK